MYPTAIAKKYPPLLRRSRAIELVIELGGSSGQFRKLAAQKKLAATAAGGTRNFFLRDGILALFQEQSTTTTPKTPTKTP